MVAMMELISSLPKAHHYEVHHYEVPHSPSGVIIPQNDVCQRHNDELDKSRNYGIDFLIAKGTSLPKAHHYEVPHSPSGVIIPQNEPAFCHIPREASDARRDSRFLLWRRESAYH